MVCPSKRHYKVLAKDCSGGGGLLIPGSMYIELQSSAPHLHNPEPKPSASHHQRPHGPLPASGGPLSRTDPSGQPARPSLSIHAMELMMSLYISGSWNLSPFTNTCPHSQFPLPEILLQAGFGRAMLHSVSCQRVLRRGWNPVGSTDDALCAGPRRSWCGLWLEARPCLPSLLLSRPTGLLTGS